MQRRYMAGILTLAAMGVVAAFVFGGGAAAKSNRMATDSGCPSNAIIKPNHGGAGTKFTITGSNFGSASTVWFQRKQDGSVIFNALATNIVVSNGLITGKVPSGYDIVTKPQVVEIDGSSFPKVVCYTDNTFTYDR
jgi:hypothetical protein